MGWRHRKPEVERRRTEESEMLETGLYNMDCMDGMKMFQDKFFDLAIVDPPYGNAANTNKNGLAGGGS